MKKFLMLAAVLAAVAVIVSIDQLPMSSTMLPGYDVYVCRKIDSSGVTIDKKILFQLENSGIKFKYFHVNFISYASIDSIVLGDKVLIQLYDGKVYKFSDCTKLFSKKHTDLPDIKELRQKVRIQ